jgi:hypothetical protein
VIPDEGLTGPGNNIAGTARSRSYGVRPVADVIDGLLLKKDNSMNRRVFIALAVAAMAFSSSTAFAGGSSKSKTQYVRIKNIGSSPVWVNAMNGTLPDPTLSAASTGARLISQNAVTQFVLKKGAGQFGVLNSGETAGTRLDYNFPNSTYVYLQARDAGDRVIATFAPPGTRF